MFYAPLSEENGKVTPAEIKEINEIFDHEGNDDVHEYDNAPQNSTACDICGRPLKDFSSMFLISTIEISFKRLAIECEEMHFYHFCPACMKQGIAVATKLKEESE